MYGELDTMATLSLFWAKTTVQYKDIIHISVPMSSSAFGDAQHFYLPAVLQGGLNCVVYVSGSLIKLHTLQLQDVPRQVDGYGRCIWPHFWANMPLLS